MENNKNPEIKNEDNQLPAGAYFVPNTALIKKEYTPLSKKENSFVFIVLAGLFIFVDFALFHGFNLGFTISYAAVFALSTAFIYKKEAKGKAFAFICGALSLILSACNTLYNNSFIKPVSVLIIGFLFAIYCLGISGGISELSGSYKFLIDLFKKTVFAPFENLENVFGSVKAGAKDKKGAFGALIGIVIALPVLIVIIPLLVSSDAAFEGLIDSIIDNIGIYLLELAISLILLPFFFLIYFRETEQKRIIRKPKKQK